MSAIGLRLSTCYVVDIIKSCGLCSGLDQRCGSYLTCKRDGGLLSCSDGDRALAVTRAVSHSLLLWYLVRHLRILLMLATLEGVR